MLVSFDKYDKRMRPVFFRITSNIFNLRLSGPFKFRDRPIKLEIINALDYAWQKATNDPLVDKKSVLRNVFFEKQ